METETKRTSAHERKHVRRRRVAMSLLALTLSLSVSSCGRRDEGPLPPHSPPRPTAGPAADLMHAHFRLPARPVPPQPGMM